MCLYAAAAQSGRGESSVTAHDFLLRQIDFLIASGLSTSSIKGLISYGHAITSMEFAQIAGKSVDKFSASDLEQFQSYTDHAYARHSCAAFSDESLQTTIKQYIARVSG